MGRRRTLELADRSVVDIAAAEGHTAVDGGGPGGVFWVAMGAGVPHNRELGARHTLLPHGRMRRVDFAATLAGIDLPDEIWNWLDLLGTVIRDTDIEARLREKSFVPDTPFRSVLQGGVQSHLSGLQAVYALLRMELVSQAAGQARLLCEGVITLRYISEVPDERAATFLEYAAIEAYEAADGLIEWDAATGDPEPVAAVAALRDSHRPRYDTLRRAYQFTDRNGKTRNYINWANRSIADMAHVHQTTRRLYGLIYRQLSSYVHGSAWSFRHLPAYRPASYDANIVLADVAQVTLGTLAVWQAFADFCDEQLGWHLAPAVARAAAASRSLSSVIAVGPRAPGT